MSITSHFCGLGPLAAERRRWPYNSCSNKIKSMKQNIQIFIKNFRNSFWQMPVLLKFLIIIGCFGVLFIIVPFIPFADFEIEGKSVDIKEFWSTGAAIGFIFTGIFLLIFVKTTINKNPRGRLFFIMAFLSACFNPYAFKMGYLLDLEYLINSLIPLGFWSWYLFVKKSVQVYYCTD